MPRWPPPQSKKPSAWKAGGATILTFVALLYVIELVDQLTGHRLDDNGIRPLEADGLWGIVFAPLLHANWAHLMANTVPALVLGFLVYAPGTVLYYMTRREQGKKLFTPMEWLVFAVAVIGAIAALHGLITGWITI